MALAGLLSWVRDIVTYALVFGLALGGLRLYQRVHGGGEDQTGKGPAGAPGATGGQGRAERKKAKKKKKQRPQPASSVPARDGGASGKIVGPKPTTSAAAGAAVAVAVPHPPSGTTPTPAPTTTGLSVGDRVEAQVGSRQEAGTVTHVHPGGRLDIQFDSGERRTRLASNQVASKKLLDAYAGSLEPPVAQKAASLRDAALASPATHGVKEGDRVEARWDGGPDFFSGVILKVHHEGLFNIQYDDGEMETKVPPHLIRRRGESQTLVVTEADIESEEEEEDDGWQLISAKKVSKAERAERQEAVANNLRNRKKKEKKRERERERIESFRNSL
uniref:Tudor domain-containing protein n=1 Tax=Rhizochromulina marina TaxID=1034831 RepID=A0A7S2SVE7_9STRA|mmetsp:Transcript_746/g.2391  ORF Transcript_746/g.2391 Transcript_746/m.2391 type:complete len:332 (+) Transcript_746:187-1182(+)